MKIPFFFLGVSLFFLSNSFAETIALKSGKTIEGKIVNRTNEYTEVEFLGVKLKYFNDQIESIKETKTPNGSPAQVKEPELISIKIKGSNTDTVKELGVADFVSRLDSINGTLDSMIGEGINKVIDSKVGKITDEQRKSIENVISAAKGKVAEVEKLKTPPSCKTLKEFFLQKSKARINILNELLDSSLSMEEMSKKLIIQNNEILGISRKYDEERQRITKEHEVKL